MRNYWLVVLFVTVALINIAIWRWGRSRDDGYYRSQAFVSLLNEVSNSRISKGMALHYAKGRDDWYSATENYVAKNHDSVYLLVGDQLMYTLVIPNYEKLGGRIRDRDVHGRPGKSMLLSQTQLSDGGEMLSVPGERDFSYMEAKKAGFVRTYFYVSDRFHKPDAVMCVDFYIKNPPQPSLPEEDADSSA